MKKRKINPEYLRQITSSDVRMEKIDALDFAISIKRFADEYLGGIMNVSIEGESAGSVALKLPVVSYLIRLLCESAYDDETVELTIMLGDRLNMTAEYQGLEKVNEAAHTVAVAKLAGFEVERMGNSLTFSIDIKTDAILQIYAYSIDEFKNLLAITYHM